LDEYIKFVQKHERFKVTYGDLIPFANFIAPKVVRLLLHQKGHESVDEVLFPTLSEERIKTLIRLRIQAKDDFELKKSLKEVQFPGKSEYDPANGYQFSVLRYKSLFNRMMLYRHDFMRRLAFQLEQNTNVQAPKMVHKDRNPCKIFTDGIPLPEYVKAVYEEITKTDPKFKDMDDFVDQLFKVFQTHYDICDAALKVQKMGQGLEPTSKLSKPVSKFPMRSQQHAMRLEDSLEDNLVEEPSEILSQDDDSDYIRESLHVLQRGDSVSKSGGAPPKLPPKEKSTCSQFALYGKCSRGDSCHYSHDKKSTADHLRKALLALEGRDDRTVKSNDPYVPKPLRQSLTHLDDVPNGKLKQPNSDEELDSDTMDS
jgi:hypothetical protein